MCLVAVGDLDAEAVFRAAEDILPPESGPDIPRDYGGSEGDTPAQSETSCRMEVSMPSFLVGFKCPAPPEGEQRLRWDILGDLACDILMGDSSSLFSRLYSQGSHQRLLRQLLRPAARSGLRLRRRRQQRSRCRDGGHFRGGPTPDL